jgi:exodeoxyribonuclease VII large subunit
MIDLESSKIAHLRERPVLKDPHVLITSRLEIVGALRDRSMRSFGHRIEMAQKDLLQMGARVRSLSPQSTLDRGYSVIQLGDGSIARDASALKPGDLLHIRLAQGQTEATVTRSAVTATESKE